MSVFLVGFVSLKSYSNVSFIKKDRVQAHLLETDNQYHAEIYYLVESSKNYLWKYTEDTSTKEQLEFPIIETRKKADSAIYFANKALNLAENLRDPELIIHIAAQIVFNFRNHDLYQEHIVLKALITAIPYHNTATDCNQIGKAYANMGLYYYYKSDFKNSARYYELAIEYYDQNIDKQSLIHAHHFGGKSLVKINKGVQALERYLEAKKISEQYQDQTVLVDIVLDISYLYLKMQELDKSINSIKNVLTKISNTKVDKTLLYVNLASNYGEKYDLDKALFYNKLGLKEVQKIGDKEKEYMLHLNMGCDYIKNDMPTKGVNALTKAIEIEKNHPVNDANRIMLRIHLARYYLSINNYKQSLNYGLKSMEMTKSLDSSKLEYYDIKHKTNEVLYKIYDEIGDHKKALAYYKEKIIHRDSIRKPNELEQINSLELKYHIDKKEKENIVLKKNNQIQQLLLKQEIMKGNLMSSMILILFVLIVLTYYFLHRKRKLNEELTLKNEIINNQKNKINQSLNIHKRTNDKLNSINDSLKRFFSLIAHDLKSPFNVTLGYTELLVSDFEKLERSDIKQHLKVIRKSTIKNYQLAQNLLSWGMSQFNGIRIYKEEISVRKIIEQVLVNYEELAAEKEIKLDHTIPDDLYGKIDKSITMIVLGNLINNAIKYTPRKGTVVVGAIKKEGNVQFFVRDNGIGISNKVKANLFKFDTIKSKQGTNNEVGTGLGLILCMELVQKHDGQLQITSKKGKGTTVEFYLQ